MLEQWLDRIGMKGFGTKMSMLEELNDNDLLQIGIKKMADRKLIIKELSLLKNMVNERVVEPGKKQNDLKQEQEGSDIESVTLVVILVTLFDFFNIHEYAVKSRCIYTQRNTWIYY